MNGNHACTCVVCGVQKGDRDPNAGWWMLVPRDVHARWRTVHALSFCPTCAPALLVRSDEAQSMGAPGESGRWRIVPVLWLNGVLRLVRRAGRNDSNLRSALGWRMAERVAALVGFEGLPRASQLREFGHIPEETP